jgi:hypothetical protein
VRSSHFPGLSYAVSTRYCLSDVGGSSNNRILLGNVKMLTNWNQGDQKETRIKKLFRTQNVTIRMHLVTHDINGKLELI